MRRGLSGPSPQQRRLAAYLEGLAEAAGHVDRREPLKDYCRGLLLPGQGKSIEPMAARLHPDRAQAVRQSRHHLVAKAPWSDEAVLAQVRRQVLPAMLARGPVVAWVGDETGIPKKGRHSVGVAPAVRRAVGQAGELPGGSHPVGGHLAGQPADRLPSVSSRGVGARSNAAA